MTDNEINRAVCEKVLGWTYYENDDYWTTPPRVPDGGELKARCPDFCNDWLAFGLLWDALVKAGRFPIIEHNTGANGETRGQFTAYVYATVDICVEAEDTDPRPALGLAALKAYGVKEENI